MTYTLRYRPGLKDEILKYLKNDPVRFEQLTKKIGYLTEHPEMGKPLRNRLKGKWRVHRTLCSSLYNRHISKLYCVVKIQTS